MPRRTNANSSKNQCMVIISYLDEIISCSCHHRQCSQKPTIAQPTLFNVVKFPLSISYIPATHLLRPRLPRKVVHWGEFLLAASSRIPLLHDVEVSVLDDPWTILLATAGKTFGVGANCGSVNIALEFEFVLKAALFITSFPLGGPPPPSFSVLRMISYRNPFERYLRGARCRWRSRTTVILGVALFFLRPVGSQFAARASCTASG